MYLHPAHNNTYTVHQVLKHNDKLGDQSVYKVTVLADFTVGCSDDVPVDKLPKTVQVRESLCAGTRAHTGSAERATAGV